jgi:putative transposase
MMKRQRYTRKEIAAKLEEADALVAEGKLHGDVAKALGVSLMTYHRWRKARESSQLTVSMQPGEPGREAPPIEQARRISELQLENSRLRRLVTDLLLEKMNLEERLLEKMNLGEGMHNRAGNDKAAARR